MKKLTTILTVSFLLLAAAPGLRAQDFENDTLSLKVYFQRNHSEIDRNFRDNGVRAEKFKASVQNMLTDPMASVQHITLRTSASPEGTTTANQRLSEERAAALERFLVDEIGIDRRYLEINAIGEDWEGLASIVRTLDVPWKDRALAIIEKTPLWIRTDGRVTDGRKNQLKSLDGGEVWNYLDAEVFPELRAAGGAVSLVIRHPIREIIHETDTLYVTRTERDTVFMASEPADLSDEELHDIIRQRRDYDISGKKFLMAVRTNVLAVPFTNVGVEVPVGENWSVGADWYSPWIWREKHSKDIDMRGWCFEFQAADIEARYWFHNSRKKPQARLLGHSLGAYAAAGHYDFERDWSGYQGEFWNVGVDYLYAAPIFGGRMHLEFELGLGYIHSDAQPYDCFIAGDKCYRQKGVTEKVRWIGPTRAQFSLVVPIYVKNKKGGK